MTYNVFSGTLNPTQSINQPNCHCYYVLPCQLSWSLRHYIAVTATTSVLLCHIRVLLTQKH